jgi:hypothetical protein
MPRPKFQIQKEIRDFTRNIPRVIEETTCKAHDATDGQPCYGLPYGVCDKRARQLFIGVPSERTKFTARAAERSQKENR